MRTDAPTTGRRPDTQAAPRPDRPGFGEAVRPHLGWLYSLTRGLIGDRHTAEDLVQRCLLKACRAYGELDDLAVLPAWLKQIQVNCCRDHWRAQRRRPGEAPLDGPDGTALSRTLTSEDPLPGSDSLHLDFLTTIETEDVWAVLERMDTIYRVPLVLVHMEGYTTAEVAALVEAPRNTVLSRLHRGRKRFRRQLWTYAHERGLLEDTQATTDATQPSTSTPPLPARHRSRTASRHAGGRAQSRRPGRR